MDLNSHAQFNCPVCGGIVYENQEKCHNCGIELGWGSHSCEYEAQDITIAGAYKLFFGNVIGLFSGRARRKEYWGTTLIHILLLLPIYILLILLMQSYLFFPLYVIYMSLYCIYMSVVATPLMALGIRRLHDIGKSGWWILIGMIPLVGWIFVLVWLCKDSEKGTNKYGKSPKYTVRGE